jgi:hypothetical protein
VCRNGKDVVISRTAHGVCLLLLSGVSLLPDLALLSGKTFARHANFLFLARRVSEGDQQPT